MSNQEEKNQEETNKEAGVEKRRRFIKGAGLAAPVIMALANRPAFGGQVCTVSGYMSVDPGNLSADGHIQETGCGGKIPNFWKTESNFGSWKATGYHPADVIGTGTSTSPQYAATLMGAAFNYPAGGLATSTMLSVLEGSGGTDQDNVYMHLVAALLNAAKGLYMTVNGLTVAEIQDMYKQISAGQFEAAPGVPWTPAQLAGFLRQTMA